MSWKGRLPLSQRFVETSQSFKLLYNSKRPFSNGRHQLPAISDHHFSSTHWITGAHSSGRSRNQEGKARSVNHPVPYQSPTWWCVPYVRTLQLIRYTIHVVKTMENKPPLTGKGNHTTHKNVDFGGGLWHCFHHMINIIIYSPPVYIPHVYTRHGLLYATCFPIKWFLHICTRIYDKYI